MSSPETQLRVEDGVSRREFLYVGGVGALGLSLADVSLAARAATLQRRHAILIVMSGGPSQLETFDPKPEAPSQIRGPLRAAQTRVPGVWLSESLPRLADRADRFALIRSLHHDYAPIHETGQQLLNSGRVVEQGIEFPHFGAVVTRSMARPTAGPSNVVLPRPLSDTGIHQHCGQTAGLWGDAWQPTSIDDAALSSEPESVRRHYGDHSFGRRLLQARQLVEAGTRCVTVNLFDRLNKQVTWDCHGDVACAPGTVFDYRDTLCPQFDQALAGLLDDLQQRGLWNDTLVVVTGEFGRTPRLNDRAGRDHWPDCWSGLVAGGGVTGGAVIGASDASGAHPIDRPVALNELTATLLGWFGIDGTQVEIASAQRPAQPLLTAAPVRELWG